MTIKLENRGQLNGTPGTVITTVEAITREVFLKSNAGVATGGKAMTIAAILGKDAADIVLVNKYSGGEMRFTAKEILESFAGIDLDNSFLDIKTVFRPDEGQQIYASDIVDQMRRSGVAESDIEKLLKQEYPAWVAKWG